MIYNGNEPHYEEPIDTGYTDKTIPIECSECSVIKDGKDAMVMHILDVHPAYSSLEAVHYADLWAETAYEEAENEIRDAYSNQ